mmetsp:Transcript_39440/g.53595  ORF Transcript_39440/g.53595 Transcript_39440/m.53595 type:complete len:221 (+) Transcript_39440:505-1167(+)
MGTEEFLVGVLSAWDVHVRGLGVGTKVEREGFVFQIGGGKEGGERVNGDSVVSETEDTTHLGNVESGTGNIGNFTEFHLSGGSTTEVDNILGNGTLDTTGTVLNDEVLTVLNEGGGFGVVIGGVSPAGNGPAVVGVDPEVGGTGIGNNLEGLGGGTNVNVDKVLGVHVVLDINNFTVGSGRHLVNLGLVTFNGEGHVSKVDSTGNGDGSEGSNKFHNVNN